MNKLEKLVDKAKKDSNDKVISKIEKELSYPYDKKDKLLQKLDSVNTGKVVFIQGLHRSGTTLLYGLLGEAGLNVFDLYRIYCYDQLIYNHINDREKLAREALDLVFKFRDAEDREFDEIKISSRTVEEYCHITAPKLSEKKYRRFGLISRVLFAMTFEGRHRTKPRNIDKLKEILKKIRFVSENDAPIAMKNPFDFNKSVFILKHIKTAKLIFLHRYPPRAVASIYKSLRADYDRKKPVSYLYLINDYYKRTFDDNFVRSVIKWASRLRITTPILMRRAAAQVNGYRLNLIRIKKDKYIKTNYKKLCTDPNGTIDAITDFLDFKNSREDLTDRIKRRHYKLPFFVRLLKPIMGKLFGDDYYVEAGDF